MLEFNFNTLTIRADRTKRLDMMECRKTPCKGTWRNAAELNPVEYIWAYWKQHELPNVCPKDYWELDERARKALRRMRRKPRLITAFWKSLLFVSIDSILRLVSALVQLLDHPDDSCTVPNALT